MLAVAVVRLVGGSSYGEGRVNIYNDVTHQWMPVCATGWTKADADVACRQLGFFSGAATGPSVGYFDELMAVSKIMRCNHINDITTFY